jgi:hypothetical protein
MKWTLAKGRARGAGGALSVSLLTYAAVSLNILSLEQCFKAYTTLAGQAATSSKSPPTKQEAHSTEA